MKTLLITCFEPFGGRATNASREAVMALPGEVCGFELRRMCLPVAFGRAAEIAAVAVNELHPAAVICVGEAGGREAITPELVAINLRHARIPDNDGLKPQDEPVVEGGENALFSTLPVREMAAATLDAGVPAEVSYTAGTYVCNDLMYLMLRHCQPLGIPCGFVHVPAGGEPSCEAVARGLCAALEAIASA